MAKAKRTHAAKTPPVTPVATPADVPAFNASNAAQAAAAIVAHHQAVQVSGPANPSTESASFKNLKESLNKPHTAALNSLLDKTGIPGQKKSAQPFAFGKQVGHNQTFGSGCQPPQCAPTYGRLMFIVLHLKPPEAIPTL